MACYFVIFFIAMTIKVHVKSECDFLINSDASLLLQNNHLSKKLEPDPNYNLQIHCAKNEEKWMIKNSFVPVFTQYKLATKSEPMSHQIWVSMSMICSFLCTFLCLNAKNCLYREEEEFSWVFSQSKITKLTKVYTYINQTSLSGRRENSLKRRNMCLYLREQEFMDGYNIIITYNTLRLWNIKNVIKNIQ